MGTTERWRAKADAYAAGWRAHFGVDPTPHNVSLGLAVAQHETLCGDAPGWEGEHNWGAVQRRVLTAEERTVVNEAGIAPSVKNVDAARNALEVAVKKGELAYAEDVALHVDSSPGKGYYWVYFWAFGTDAEGAALFVKILAVNRASCRAVLESPTGTALALAQAMYASRYYEGFRLPNAWYTKRAGKWVKLATGEDFTGAVTGRTLNAMDYGGAVAAIQPGIFAALQGWTPSPSGSVPPSEPATLPVLRLHDKGEGVANLQRLLGVTADGNFGPKTLAALVAVQTRAGLAATGVCDGATWAVLTAPDASAIVTAARLLKLSDTVMAGTEVGGDALARLLGDG